MIVAADFLDHWKTLMLVNELGEVAPLYVIRLWGHCQNRKTAKFDTLTAEAIKAICRFAGDAQKLEAALIAAGFVERDGKSILVCNWDEYNSTLVAAWENGRKGGRKPKNGTHGKPTGYPAVTSGLTQSEPRPNPAGTDKRREEKKRKEPSPSGVKVYEERVPMTPYMIAKRARMAAEKAAAEAKAAEQKAVAQ